MKTTIINTSDIDGGAALAGYNIMEALNHHTEFETRILCGTKFSNDDNIDDIVKGKLKLFDKWTNNLIIKNTIGQNYWLPSKNRILSHPLLKDTDIINLHNAHGDYFAYPVISKLSNLAPLVVSMQDMWYVTGHCGYAFDCTKYETLCEKCPHLDTYPGLKYDTTRFHWKKKEKIYANADIYFVTCSQWLKKEAEKSPLFKGKTVQQIYNPINTENLKPRDKKIIRKLLEIPKDKNIIAFGAANIGNERKGFPQLLHHLEKSFIRKNDIFFLLMGRNSRNILGNIPPYVPYKHFGSIIRDEFRSYIYNAADIFIFPTLADNLPNMLIESLACGTPCVTFDVGGCGEVIQTDYTGYLATAFDYNDFLLGIQKIIDEKNMWDNLAKNSREFALDNFSYINSAKRYADFFKSILKA
jgi:glycosyltransferase involved in cell wall biosynthesis